MDPERENKLIEKSLGLVRYRVSRIPIIDAQSNIPDRVYPSPIPTPSENLLPKDFPLGWFLDMLD